MDESEKRDYIANERLFIGHMVLNSIQGKVFIHIHIPNVYWLFVWVLRYQLSVKRK